MDFSTMILIANGGFVAMMILLMWIGYKNGLILSLVNTLGWILALTAGYLFSSAAAEVLMIFPISLTPMNETAFGPVFQQMLNEIIWFFLIAAVVKLVCLLLKPIAKGFRRIPVLGFFNNLAGALFGIVNMWILTSLVCVLLSLPMFPWGKQLVDESLLKSASLVSGLIAEKIEISTEDVNELLEYAENLKQMDDQQIEQIRQKLSEIGITQEQIDALFENLE